VSAILDFLHFRYEKSKYKIGTLIHFHVYHHINHIQVINHLFDDNFVHILIIKDFHGGHLGFPMIST